MGEVLVEYSAAIAVSTLSVDSPDRICDRCVGCASAASAAAADAAAAVAAEAEAAAAAAAAAVFRKRIACSDM